MKKVIDMDSWERRDNFEFFRGFMNPYITVTCFVDASHAKAAGDSFFLRYLHAILYAVNHIPEFHYRIDKEGTVVSYDVIDALSPVKIAGKKGFVTVLFPYDDDFTTFCQKAKTVMQKAAEKDAYGVESGLAEYNVVLVSAIPGLPFTSLSCTQRHRNGNDNPLINVGMMSDDFKMPIAVSVHHGFVDGEQLSDFYRLVQRQLDV